MLEEGKVYWIRTAGTITMATCLVNISKDRALFVKKGSPTPFVSWAYNQDKIYPGNDALNCATGNYYKTLQEAMKEEKLI